MLLFNVSAWGNTLTSVLHNAHLVIFAYTDTTEQKKMEQNCITTQAVTQRYYNRTEQNFIIAQAITQQHMKLMQ